MKEKSKKIDVQGLIEEFRGKDKVTIKSMRKEENGKWRVSYIEDKGKTDILDFDSRNEAQEFCFAFGGKNHLTVSAKQELLNLTGWNEKDLFDMGHKLISLSISKSYSSQNTEKVIPHKSPLGCGTEHLPGSNKTMPTKEKHGITLVERFSQFSSVGCKKIQFSEEDSLENLCDWVKGKLPEFNLQISRAVTQNMEFKTLCVWVRKKVGDGSKSMQLRLDRINGESFQNFMYAEILKVADGMASSECERIYMKRRTEVVEDRCGFSLT